MKKRILSALLAASLVISMLPWSALAAEGEGTMQLGLNATFSQITKVDAGARVLCDRANELCPGNWDEANHGNGNGDQVVDENNKLFDEMYEGLLRVTSLQAEGIAISKIGELADVGKFQEDSYWTEMTGKATVATAGDYTFSGRMDNGLVLEFTDPDTGVTQRAFEFWGIAAWADADQGVLGNTLTLEAKTYDVKAYFIEYWGGNLCDLRATLNGERKGFDDYIVLSEATAKKYVPLNGDIDAMNTAIGGGSEGNEGVFEGNQNYDESIDAIKALVTETGKQVAPTITLQGNDDFRAKAAAANALGNDAIIVEYEGYITPLVSGEYKFGIEKADNGIMLEIDGNRVVEYWGAKTWYDNNANGVIYDASEAITLEAGVAYPFKAEYLEIDGGEILLIRAKSGDTEYRLDENFIFTQTDVVDVEAAKAQVPTLADPMELGEIGRGEKAIFDGFANLPEGTQNIGGVVIDEATGIATFNNKATYLELPSSITTAINGSDKLIVEAVIKAYNSPGHGYIASVGTSTNEGDDIRTALMGTREGWAIKTITMNDTCPKNVLSYGVWAKAKWVFDANGTKMYVNDVLVGENANAKVKLDLIEGNFRINRATNSWDDDGLVGQMADFRITIADPDFVPSNNADIDAVKVKGLKATVDGDAITAVVNGEVTAEDVVATLADAYASYEVAEDLTAITVTAEDGTEKAYTLTITAPEGDMALGLNATYYQTKGQQVNDGWVFGNIIKEATGYENNYANSSDAGQLNEDGTPAPQNALFDESIDALLAATTKLGELTGETKFNLINNWGTRRAEVNAKLMDTLVHYEGTLTVAEGKEGEYQIYGKIDNGAAVFIDDQMVYEYWGNRSWADGKNVTGATITLDAGEHKFEMWWMKQGGGQMCDIRAKRTTDDAGSNTGLGGYFALNMNATAYGVIGFAGDVDAMNTALGGAANEENTGNLTGNQNYDETIDAVKAIVHKTGEQVMPTITFPGNDRFRTDAAKAGTNGDESILVEYEGYITPKVSGNYKFGLEKVDNGIMMEIDGQRVAEYWAARRWYDNGSAGIVYDPNIEEIYLEAGVAYPFKASYLEINGGEVLLLRAKSGDTEVSLNDAFVFTQTAVVDLEAATPTLDEAAADMKVVSYLNFKNDLPEGVNNTDVVIDKDTGVAKFNGAHGDGASMLELPESVTEAIKGANEVTVEFVARLFSSPENGIIASVGTAGDACVIMGTKSGWVLKTASTNSPAQVVRHELWHKIKYVFSETDGIAIYVDDALVVENKDEARAFDNIAGNLRIGRYSVNGWVDPGFNGEMREVRVSVNQPLSNDTSIRDVKINGVAATVNGDDISAIVPKADAYEITATVGEGASYEVAADLKSIKVIAADRTEKTYNLTIIDKAVYPSEPSIVQTIELNVDTPTGNGDYFYDKVFTNVAPGVYKIAYYISDVAPTEDWQTRVSPIVKGPGVGNRRCWVDFRYKSAIQASIDENGLSNDVIIAAVITVPEGYDTIEAGAFVEANLNGHFDKVVLATGNYDFKDDPTHDWAVERANTGTFGEDPDNKLQAPDGTWTPSTRATSEEPPVNPDPPAGPSYAQPDENGIIVEFPASGFESGDKKWDGNVDKTLDDNGNLVMPAGNAGNFNGAYYRDVRPTEDTMLKQGVYKVVFLFDVAADSGNVMRLQPFNQDTDWRPNERMSADEWAAVKGKKAAFVFVFETAQDVNDFEILGWKGSEFAGTFNGVYVCAADCNIYEAFAGYEIAYEGAPAYYKGGETQAAPEGSWTASAPVSKSNNTDLASVTVNGVAATINGDVVTVDVPFAAQKEIVATPADANATVVVAEDGTSITVTAEDGTEKTYTLTINMAEAPKSNDTGISEVKVNGVAATINGDVITVEVDKADSYEITAVVATGATFAIAVDGKSITVTAEDGTTKVYTLEIKEKATQAPDDKPVVKNPTNGTAVVNGKTVLYKDGKAVTGTKVVTVAGKTYVVVKGVVATGKKKVVKVTAKKSYIVDKNGVVIKGKKNKLVKVTAKKSYIVKKSGVVIKNNKSNKLVKIGKKSYIVNKKGVVVKGKKNKLVKVAKKKYVVNKKGIVQKNKKKIKVGKKYYKTNKKGVATKR